MYLACQPLAYAVSTSENNSFAASLQLPVLVPCCSTVRLVEPHWRGIVALTVCDVSQASAAALPERDLYRVWGIDWVGSNQSLRPLLRVCCYRCFTVATPRKVAVYAAADRYGLAFGVSRVPHVWLCPVHHGLSYYLPHGGQYAYLRYPYLNCELCRILMRRLALGKST